MKTRGFARTIARSAVVAGAGSLIESAQKTLGRRIARRKRALAMRQAGKALKSLGKYAAVATLAYGTFAFIRSLRPQPLY